jgi:cation:H+ antiporter
MIFYGAKCVLSGTLRLSHSLGLEKFVVGTLLVGSITALPELFSSVMAAVWGSSRLAFGNLLGTNIYNLPLLIGLCGLAKEFEIKNSIVKGCQTFIALNVLLASITLATGGVTPVVGALFLGFYALYIFGSLRRNGGHYQRDPRPRSRRAAAFVLAGGGSLVLGSMLLVRGALGIMEKLGLEGFAVGVLIVSLGPIIPEVAVSLIAALRGEHEVSMGNIIGDNTVTITLVFGLVALMRPFEVSPTEVLATIPFSIIFTGLLILIKKINLNVTRGVGLAMLASALATFVFQMMIL